MNPFTVKLSGKSLKITNNLNSPVKILEIILKYRITVNMIDDKLGLKTITENIKMDKELKSKEFFEIQVKFEDISEVSIVYKDDITFRRIDITL